MKPYLLISLLSLSATFSFAQTSRTDVVADTTEKPKTSLNLAAIYASNASYYGQTSGLRLPYVLGHASLSFSTGFFISAAAYKLLDYGSGISGIGLTAGYDFKLAKNLSGSLSFSRSFYPDSSLFIQSTNPNIASASLSYDWKVLSTGLSADYAPGSDGALFTTFSVSKSVDLGSLVSPKDYISFDPAFELVGGTQRITTTEQVPAKSNNGNSKRLLILPIGSSGTSKPQYREVERTSFDLISYNLKLPVSYNRASYAVEASYEGSVLGKKVAGATQKLNSFFYLGVYYAF